MYRIRSHIKSPPRPAPVVVAKGRPERGSRPWTEVELDFILNHYDRDMSGDEIAAHLKRSVSAVEKRFLSIRLCG